MNVFFKQAHKGLKQTHVQTNMVPIPTTHMLFSDYTPPLSRVKEEEEKKQESLLKASKLDLIQLVCGSLLQEPNFKDAENPTRKSLLQKVEKVVVQDPEFILKLALYSR